MSIGSSVLGWAGAHSRTLATTGAVGAGSAVALNLVDRDNSSSGTIAKYAAYTTAGSGAAWAIGHALRKSSDASRAVALLGGGGRALLPLAAGVTAGAVAVKLLD